MTTFVMCGGKQKRWNGPGLKQMSPIHGRPIVWRTFDQIAGPAVVVASPAQYDTIMTGYDGPATLSLCDSSETDLWVEGFLATEPLWQDRNVCLLGDVWFSHNGYEATQRPGLHCIGRHGQSPYTGGPGETFALCWEAKDSQRLKDACKVAIEHRKTYPDTVDYDPKGCPLGTPWQPYRALASVHLEENHVDGDIWQEVNDWTDDVDDNRRYTMFRRRLESLFPEAPAL